MGWGLNFFKFVILEEKRKHALQHDFTVRNSSDMIFLRRFFYIFKIIYLKKKVYENAKAVLYFKQIL
jgi:hypothetical protein